MRRTLLQMYASYISLFLVPVVVTRHIEKEDQTLEISSHKSRRRRSLETFAEMIQCSTGLATAKSVAAVLGDYGCYCGLGGGGTPVDATDRCCKEHDECYGRVQASQVCPYDFLVYIISYSVSMMSCRDSDFSPEIKCALLADYGWSYLYPACSVSVCQCDLAAARCFAASREYDLRFTIYNRELCFS